MRTMAAPDEAFPKDAGGGWLAGFGLLYDASDMELRDVGLRRGDIPAVISGMYHLD